MNNNNTFLIKGLPNISEYAINLETVANDVLEIFGVLTDTFSKLDVDFETAILIAKQSRHLKEVGFTDVNEYVMMDTPSLKFTFDIDNNISVRMYLYRDEEGVVEYGYYNHDYAYIVDKESGKVLFDYFFGDDTFSIWAS